MEAETSRVPLLMGMDVVREACRDEEIASVGLRELDRYTQRRKSTRAQLNGSESNAVQPRRRGFGHEWDIRTTLCLEQASCGYPLTRRKHCPHALSTCLAQWSHGSRRGMGGVRVH